jgi:hypothetical protein
VLISAGALFARLAFGAARAQKCLPFPHAFRPAKPQQATLVRACYSIGTFAFERLATRGACARIRSYALNSCERAKIPIPCA